MGSAICGGVSKWHPRTHDPKLGVVRWWCSCGNLRDKEDRFLCTEDVDWADESSLSAFTGPVQTHMCRACCDRKGVPK